MLKNVVFIKRTVRVTSNSLFTKIKLYVISKIGRCLRYSITYPNKIVQHKYFTKLTDRSNHNMYYTNTDMARTQRKYSRYFYFIINMSKHCSVHSRNMAGFGCRPPFKLRPSGFLLTINKSINIYG